MTCNHTIHKHNHHYGWDNSIEPILSLAPGKTVEVQTVDASGGQLSALSTLADLAVVSFERVNPVTGPIFIEGAEPGDAVAVTFLDFKPSGWGWTANIPGFGLLADDFADPALHIWTYDSQSLAPALYGPGGKVPVNTSGGLVSKGHPVGATGLSMIYELTTQLRGEAGERQVDDARIALAENGGGVMGFEEAACSVTILERARD